jgi:predicted transcriptional regulator
MVGELVERLFAGDPKALVAHLVSEHELDADEIRDLQRQLDSGSRRGRK